MIKTLHTDTGNLKFSDTNTPIKLTPYDNGARVINQSYVPSVVIKDVNVGYVKTISSMWQGDGVVINSSDLSDLPVGQYGVELWLDLGAERLIYPDYGVVKLNINENITGTTGELVSSISLAEFKQQFADLSSDLNEYIRGLSTIPGPQGPRGPKGDTGPQGPAGDNNYLNVKDFGAVGDGVHDDTSAIQQALDVIGVIWFEANKTYNITSPLIVHGNTIIIGNGATVKYTGPIVRDHGMFEVDGSNVVFKKIKLNGNILDQIAAGLISQHTYTVTESKGLDGIRNSTGVDVSNILIDDCTFTEIQKMGIVINTNAGKNLTAQNNVFEYTNRDGVWLVGDNVKMLDNVFLNSHDNALVFDATFGSADHHDILISGNMVYQSKNVVNDSDVTGESYMDGVFIDQVAGMNLDGVVITGNIIKARYLGITVGHVQKGLLISNNTIEVGNHNATISPSGIDIKNSSNGIISLNKILANAYGINGNSTSDNFDIFNNDARSNYRDYGGFSSSKVKNNVSRGTSSTELQFSLFTSSSIIDNNLEGANTAIDLSDTTNIVLRNLAGTKSLPESKTKLGITLPPNNTNGLSFDATVFFNTFNLTQNLVDIGPNTGAGLEFVVIVLNNKTDTPINVSAVTLKNFKSTTVQPGGGLTLMVARYDLYTVIAQS